MSPTVQRIVGIAVLLVAGLLSLPVAAYFLDGQARERWIVPVQVLAMALIGAGVTVALPALAGAGTQAPRRRALMGVGWGLLGALVGVLASWVLLSG